MKDYAAARLVWGSTYYFGVITLVLAFLITGMSACVIFAGKEPERSKAIMIACCSAGAFLIGLLLMAFSELVLAVIDTASNTQEMLKSMRKETVPSGIHSGQKH